MVLVIVISFYDSIFLATFRSDGSLGTDDTNNMAHPRVLKVIYEFYEKNADESACVAMHQIRL